jgi:hypothetical protein
VRLVPGLFKGKNNLVRIYATMMDQWANALYFALFHDYRTHHWSPLKEEVEFIRTSRDHDLASFDCAKDRHIFPWVDVNARFGFIKYKKNIIGGKSGKRGEEKDY